jgi:hypothetical protein
MALTPWFKDELGMPTRLLTAADDEDAKANGRPPT